MMHILIIASFLVLFVRDELHEPVLLRGLGLGSAAMISLALMGLVWALAQSVVWWQTRRMDRGRTGAVLWADRAVMLSRLAAVAVHGVNVLLVGWLDVVRQWVGDVVVLDELVAVLPVLLVFVGGWWTLYPVERRVRDAILMRDLDMGRPVRPMPARGVYVLTTLRHQAALVLVPILVILSWRETIELAARRDWLPDWIPREGLHLAGAVLALMLMPLVLRRVWDTIDLEPGPLRDDLVAMCKEHGIRVRQLLLWRTHGTMINGAVLGLIGPARYVLLTDALLESLTEEQVRAVMAHELGHIRRRHMLWLLAAGVCGIPLALAGVQYGLWRIDAAWSMSDWGQAAVLGLGLAAVLVAFGFVSRRFEWQADAFAAQHLSGWRGRRDQRALVVSEEAAQVMVAALGSVAALNHIPRRRFTWRHGSIAARQERLMALVGRPAGRLKPDRDAAVVKGVIAACGAVVLALVMLNLIR
jgi:STE24 endopeptidase